MCESVELYGIMCESVELYGIMCESVELYGILGRCCFKDSSLTRKRKSLDAYMLLIAKNSICLSDLFFYVSVNSYGHVDT